MAVSTFRLEKVHSESYSRRHCASQLAFICCLKSDTFTLWDADYYLVDWFFSPLKDDKIHSGLSKYMQKGGFDTTGQTGTNTMKHELSASEQHVTQTVWNSPHLWLSWLLAETARLPLVLRWKQTRRSAPYLRVHVLYRAAKCHISTVHTALNTATHCAHVCLCVWM